MHVRQNWRVDVLVYSSHSGMGNVARIVQQLKPSILFHLSDEFRERIVDHRL